MHQNGAKSKKIEDFLLSVATEYSANKLWWMWMRIIRIWKS